jgi:Transglycosylase SLT domain
VKFSKAHLPSAISSVLSAHADTRPLSVVRPLAAVGPWVLVVLVTVMACFVKVAFAATPLPSPLLPPLPKKAAPPLVSASNCYHSVGAQYGLSPLLLAGIAQVESGFNPKAVNRSHWQRTKSVDIGLTQVNSQNTHLLKRFGYVEQDLYEPCKNLNVGALVLSDLFARKGVTWDAIGAYNAACTQLKGKDCDRARSVYAWKVHRAMGQIASRYPAFSTEASAQPEPLSSSAKPVQRRVQIVRIVGLTPAKPETDAGRQSSAFADESDTLAAKSMPERGTSQGLPASTPSSQADDEEDTL